MMAALGATRMNSEAKTVAKWLACLDDLNNILKGLDQGLYGDNDEVEMVTPMLRLKCDQSYYSTPFRVSWERASEFGWLAAAEKELEFYDELARK
jgi:hypothetical protein